MSDFNKRILKTVEDNEMYVMQETFFLDGKRYPDMYNALVDCFSIFWTPRNYKDIMIRDSIIKHRKEFFGDNHVRSEYASLGDLFLYMAREAQKQIPETSVETHLHSIFKCLNFYNMNVHNKRLIARELNKNIYYFERDGKTLYSMFGFPRSRDEARLTIKNILRQYIYLYKKGRYVKGLYTCEG